jgi:hypothetical protein
LGPVTPNESDGPIQGDPQEVPIALSGDPKTDGDESDARMAEIEVILDHAAIPHLEKCGLVAEWVRHAEAKASVYGQFVQKPGGGRPEGGVARAARALPVPGKSTEARRKFIERALKIDGIWQEVKVAVRAARLHNKQSALLAIASEHSAEAQLAKGPGDRCSARPTPEAQRKHIREQRKRADCDPGREADD